VKDKNITAKSAAIDIGIIDLAPIILNSNIKVMLKYRYKKGFIIA
jgi:hypothetical protein